MLELTRSGPFPGLTACGLELMAYFQPWRLNYTKCTTAKFFRKQNI